jgi:uncharacterized delta-60 repeat protein
MISLVSLRPSVLALMLLVAAPLAAGNPGDLDPTFGTAGVVVTQVGTVFSGAAAALLQPDGKLVAVGVSGTPLNITVVRYNPDGTLDPGFGVKGVAVTLVGKDGSGASAAVLQPDGKIIVAGQTQQVSIQGINGPLGLLRYMPDGSLDGSFGTGGIVIFPASNGGQFSQYFDVSSIVLEPDGKSVVSGTSSFGTSGIQRAELIRFNVDGSLDSSFGNGGVALLDPAMGGVATVQPDGKILVAGTTCGSSCGPPRYVVSRVDTSGALDPTFGVGGITPVPISAPPEFPVFYTYPINDIVLQPDGKLLISSRGTVLQDVLVATRLNPDGSVDDQFAGGKGVVMAIGDTLPAGFNDPFANVTTAIGLQSDGKVILVGNPWDRTTAAFHFGAVRYNADGTLDTTFGDFGIAIGPKGGFNSTLVKGGFNSTLVQPDDKLVVAGNVNTAFVLARFLPDTGTSVVLATNLNPSPLGQSVTLTATVQSRAPTGTVQFRDGTTAVAGCAAMPVISTSTGSMAECMTAALSAGAHVLNAAYSGDVLNPAGQSSMLIQIISTPGVDIAVEYLYPPWNHYFITSLPAEIAALDGGVFPGWQRTGEAFAVYPSGAPLTLPLCRFFSGSTFAPKSSHFYTPYPFECNFVKQTEYPAWTFEGNVTPVQLPNASGNCATGARPLYRLFNNGQGAAPNHRYTTSLATRASMIAQGWMPEGAGTIGVIACVPGN